MHRLIAALSGTLLLAAVLFAAPQSSKTEPDIHCTLTGKNVTKCCCQPRGEKLYCTLAKKTIDKCCCEPPQKPQGQ